MRASEKGRLVIAQPHELLCDALETLLVAAGLEVVARCTRPCELDHCVGMAGADVALLDAEMAAGGDVEDVVGAVRRGLPDGKIVLLAPGLDPALARSSLQLEVDGVVLKRAAGDDVVAALRRVVAGDAVFPCGWLAAAHRAEAQALSARQLEVLELIAAGLPNETIAERLFISKNTVKFHVAAIYQRLGVRNRVQASHALAELRGAG
jgi:DNA-binding NarL/FixJ family response regulator